VIYIVPYPRYLRVILGSFSSSSYDERAANAERLCNALLPRAGKGRTLENALLALSPTPRYVICDIFMQRYLYHGVIIIYVVSVTRKSCEACKSFRKACRSLFLSLSSSSCSSKKPLMMMYAEGRKISREFRRSASSINAVYSAESISFVRATARRNGRRTSWDNAAINYQHQIITPGFNCAYKITSRRLLPRVQYLCTLERSSAAEIPAR